MPARPEPAVAASDPVHVSHLRALTVPTGLGLVHALSFAPGPLPGWALPWVQIFSLAVLLHLLTRAPRITVALRTAYAFGLGNFTLGLYWLFISMHIYGGLAPPLAALGVLALAGFLALFPLLAAGLGWVIAPRRNLDSKSAQVMTALVWASAWTLAEWLRGHLFTGFPWLNTGYAHIDTVFAPWAPLTGVYGLSWLAAFASAAIAQLIRGNPSARTTQHGGPEQLPMAATPARPLSDGQPPAATSHTPGRRVPVLATVLAISTGIAGIGLNQLVWVQPHGEPMIIRLVQGNVPQSEKFDPELINQGMARYLELASLDPKSDEGQPELIVLPETVIPVFQDMLAPQAWEAWRALAARFDATVLLGVPLRDPVRDHYTNSVIALDQNTPSSAISGATMQHRYDKHHLVPFGEFVPRGFRWFTEAMHIPLGDFNRGAQRQPPFDILGQHIAPNICYEDVFGEEIIRAVAAGSAPQSSASILVNVSNLAWFGDTWALRQHLQISRMRAAETGRPMIRATNTGMTAAIDHHGVVRAALQPMAPGVLDVEVQGMQGLTPYARWGNRPLMIGLLSLLLAGLVYRRRQASSRSA